MSKAIVSRLLKGAVEFRKYEEAKAKADAAWKASQELLLGRVGHCMTYSSFADGFNIEIDLGTYLTLYPDAKPVRREWVYEGKTRESFDYPARHVGEKNGVNLWVSARFAAPISEPSAQTPETEAA